MTSGPHHKPPSRQLLEEVHARLASLQEYQGRVDVSLHVRLNALSAQIGQLNRKLDSLAPVVAHVERLVHHKEELLRQLGDAKRDMAAERRKVDAANAYIAMAKKVPTLFQTVEGGST